MIGWERRVLLRHYLDEGLTVTEISRELGISRQTIYRWINEGELDRNLEEVRYGPRPPVPTKLDPYKAIVRERLEEYPELTAVRLLAEIRAAGYPGGYTQLKEYVGRCGPGLRPTLWCGSTRTRACRARWTSPTSASRGAAATRSWSCSATRSRLVDARDPGHVRPGARGRQRALHGPARRRQEPPRRGPRREGHQERVQHHPLPPR